MTYEIIGKISYIYLLWVWVMGIYFASISMRDSMAMRDPKLEMFGTVVLTLACILLPFVGIFMGTYFLAMISTSRQRKRKS